ncbi:MAG: hypothetical protein C0514_09330 [Candidatus Puniceispirillum sp.]|nr:hypothetical protein [Candidatus Puniceispirillum sp.]
MIRALLILLMIVGSARVQACATEDGGLCLAGRPHHEQYDFFKTTREQGAASLTQLPCDQCDWDRTCTGQAHRLDRVVHEACEDESWTCTETPRGDYCCPAVAYQAQLLRAQTLDPEVRERLDLLAKSYTTPYQGRIRLPKVEDMLAPILGPYKGWTSNINRARVAPELVFCRAVYGYFCQALVDALLARGPIGQLSFASVGIHPLLIPALEGFARQGQGPRSLSFGARHLCHCTDEDASRLNAAVRQMPFLTYVTLSRDYVSHTDEEAVRVRLLKEILMGTSVKGLVLSGPPKHCCAPHVVEWGPSRVVRQTNNEAIDSATVEECVYPLSLSAGECQVLEESALEALTLRVPELDGRLLASVHFGQFLKNTKTLKSLALRGGASGVPHVDGRAFVESFLGNASLRAFGLDAEKIPKDFGLTDADLVAIGAHVERNRARLSSVVIA